MLLREEGEYEFVGEGGAADHDDVDDDDDYGCDYGRSTHSCRKHAISRIKTRRRTYWEIVWMLICVL